MIRFSVILILLLQCSVLSAQNNENLDSNQDNTSVSILNKEISKGELLHPNPTEGVFFLADLTERDKVRIFDGTGRMVHEMDGFNGKTKVNLSHLEKGIYLVTVRDENKRLIVNQKVVLK